MKATIVVLVAAAVLITACSSQQEASEVDWGNLPEGTQEWVAEGLRNNECDPIRSTLNYVIFRADEQTPSPAYLFLEDASNRMNCDSTSENESFTETLNTGLKMEDVERLSAPSENPVWFGPGCIGTIVTLGALRKLRPQDDSETKVALLGLAIIAIPDSLPIPVLEGTRDPTQSEHVALQAASALFDLSLVLLANGPEGELQISNALDNIQMWTEELDLACAIEYKNGPQPVK